MSLFSIQNIAVKGLACAVPKNVFANKDYPYHSEKENQQFIATTGIEYRRIAPPNMTAADLCEQAAHQVLKDLEWAKEEINILIFLSQTPDYKIPCTATILQDKLGLPKSCLAFDVNLGCSGYVYGLSIVSSLLYQIKRKALLLVGDVSSSCIHPKDKTTAPLFSDAGSATALEFDANAATMYYNLQSDGSGHDAIITKDGGMRSPISEASFQFDEISNRRPMDMFLDGIKVFNFSRKEVVPNVEQLLENFNIERESIDYFIFHQANLFMNESIRKKLKLAPEKVPYSLKEFGNTSSASVPVTIVKSLKEILNQQNKQLLLSGFGVGLSWGSCLVNFNKVKVGELVEVK